MTLPGRDPMLAVTDIARELDPEGSVCTMAFIELGDHLEQSMLPMIERRLGDPDAIVRQRAADYRDRDSPRRRPTWTSRSVYEPRRRNLGVGWSLHCAPSID